MTAAMKRVMPTANDARPIPGVRELAMVDYLVTLSYGDSEKGEYEMVYAKTVAFDDVLPCTGFIAPPPEYHPRASIR